MAEQVYFLISESPIKNDRELLQEVKRTERDAKSDECEQLEKELEDAKARNKPEFMLQMIEDKIQTDCVEVGRHRF